ncbi:MAG: hypothetical protein ACREOP_06575 [Thermodesulfobacteriota bacterium]
MRKVLLSSAAVAVLITIISLGNIWECRTGGVVEYTIAFFANGTGTRSDIGDFTWVQTECKQLEFTADTGEFATLKGLQVTGGIIGGDKFGQFKFNQVSPDLGNFGYTCELIVF